jgi:hypothetical protein
VPWLDDCSRTAPPAPSQGWLECLGIRGWLPSESPAALRRKARLASVGIRSQPTKPVVLVEDNGPIHTSKLTLAALAARAHWLTVE